jgi:hypothetical protein
MVYLLDGIGLATRAWDGLASEAEIDAYVAGAGWIDGLTLACQVLTAIAVLAWLHRAVANTPTLGGGIPRWTPAKSAAWWLVPFANFVVPWTIVHDLWRRTSPRGTATGGALVAAWWLLYVGGNLSSTIIANLMTLADTPQAIRSSLALTAATIGCVALSGVLFIGIIRGLESWADARAAAWSAPPPGSWPAPPADSWSAAPADSWSAAPPGSS